MNTIWGVFPLLLFNLFALWMHKRQPHSAPCMFGRWGDVVHGAGLGITLSVIAYWVARRWM